MAAAVLLAAARAELEVPAWPYRLAQGFIGLMIARAITPAILREMVEHWPMFLLSICGVLVFSNGLGALLARWQVLPGSTAVWGSAPGAATAMALMAEAYGGDVRLVAFMQYLRVVVVALIASIVARVVASGHAGAAVQPALLVGPVLLTCALACGGVVLGSLAKVPAGPLIVPMVLGLVLSNLGLITIALPPWLLACCYVLVGWSIGLRFTRDILAYAGRAFPRVLASILALVSFCGALGFALHWIAGVDPLTAYLATSPGGADSVAIIAASSKVDLPFVMAMQTGRFVLVLLLGPSLARTIARWAVVR
jgi:membrane AbrB-like protein